MRRIQIAINGRFLGRRITGVDRFAHEVLRVFDSLYQKNNREINKFSFRIFVPSGSKIGAKFRYLPVQEVGRIFKGQLWEQFELPFYLKGYSLLLNPCNTAPLVIRNQIIVVHDATPLRIPKAFTFAFRNWYRFLIPALGFFAKQIITVSNFSKDEIHKVFKIPLAKIKVVHEAGSHILSSKKRSGTFADFSQRRFVLMIGNQSEHKNFNFVISAYERIQNPDFDLVIAGGKILRVFDKKGLLDTSRKIKYLGYVADWELKELYQKALCFIYPSIYEGFGIPLLEAMSCGCPVLASNITAIPEVCGEAASLFNPYNQNEFLKLLRKITSNGSYRKELSRKGLIRSSQFSWEVAAKKILTICSESISSSNNVA